MVWHNVNGVAALTLVFCLGLTWGAFRVLVWLTPVSFWCSLSQAYCSAGKCACWDWEKKQQRADRDLQSRKHENHPRHHA